MFTPVYIFKTHGDGIKRFSFGTFLKMCYNFFGEVTMKKRTISWRGIIFTIFVTLLFFLGFFVLLVGNTFRNQIQRTYKNENQRAIQSWAAMMSERLDTYDGYLTELTRTVYGNTGLRTGLPMDFRLRKKCADAMSDKINTATGVDVMFILSEGSDAPIISAKNARTDSHWEKDLLSIKSYLNSWDFPSQPIMAKKWELVQIDGEAYVFRAVHLGKYRVGMLSALSNFDFTSKIHILGSSFGCILALNEKSYSIALKNWDSNLPLNGNELPPEDGNVTFLTAELPNMGAQLVLATGNEETAPMYNTTLRLLTIIGFSCISLTILLMYVLYQMVSIPVKEMLAATDRVKAGDLNCQMGENWGNREFDTLSANFNAMVSSVRAARIAEHEHEVQKRQEELTMLRAQIQPHFFLNAITTVSNMTYQNRNEEIRQYIAALAKFMRYMLNISCKQVSVAEELVHIDNYVKMQAIRFPDSVQIETHIDPEAKDLKIPYLLLFTVVENAFKHAMSLYGTLELHVSCESVDTERFHGYCLKVQDNGQGFSPEVLERLQDISAPMNAKEHLGLTNVRRTLVLSYGRNDLLRLYNLPEGGALVEIWIPNT